jgi:hypothetical protein
MCLTLAETFDLRNDATALLVAVGSDLGSFGYSSSIVAVLWCVLNTSMMVDSQELYLLLLLDGSSSDFNGCNW